MRLIDMRRAEVLWQHDEGATPLGISDELVAVRQRDGRLAFLETATGIARVQTDLQITDARLLATPDRLYIIAQDGTGGSQIVTIASDSGRQLNSIRLPRTLNVSTAPVAAYGGAMITVSAVGSRPSAVLLNRDGAIIEARLLEHGFFPLQQGPGSDLLLWHQRSPAGDHIVLQPFSSQRLQAAPTLPLVTWPQPQTQAQLLEQVLPFPLQTWRGGRYVAGWLQDGTLRMYLEIDPMAQPAVIHMSAEEDPLLDILGQMIRVERGELAEIGSGGWEVVAHRARQEANGILRVMIDLAPPPLLRPGRSLRLLIGDEGPTGGPWWLLRFQHPLPPPRKLIGPPKQSRPAKSRDDLDQVSWFLAWLRFLEGLASDRHALRVVTIACTRSPALT